jgi:hypothetical protein
MLIARYWLMIPILAIAGSLARKQAVPASAGTLPTDTPLFVGWLIAIILLVGALVLLTRAGPGTDCGTVVNVETGDQRLEIIRSLISNL